MTESGSCPLNSRPKKEENASEIRLKVSSSLRFYEGLAAELTTTFILALG